MQRMFSNDSLRTLSFLDDSFPIPGRLTPFTVHGSKRDDEIASLFERNPDLDQKLIEAADRLGVRFGSAQHGVCD